MLINYYFFIFFIGEEWFRLMFLKRDDIFKFFGKFFKIIILEFFFLS